MKLIVTESQFKDLLLANLYKTTKIVKENELIDDKNLIKKYSSDTYINQFINFDYDKLIRKYTLGEFDAVDMLYVAKYKIGSVIPNKNKDLNKRRLIAAKKYNSDTKNLQTYLQKVLNIGKDFNKTFDYIRKGLLKDNELFIKSYEKELTPLIFSSKDITKLINTYNVKLFLTTSSKSYEINSILNEKDIFNILDDIGAEDIDITFSSDVLTINNFNVKRLKGADTPPILFKLKFVPYRQMAYDILSVNNVKIEESKLFDIIAAISNTYFKRKIPSRNIDLEELNIDTTIIKYIANAEDIFAQFITEFKNESIVDYVDAIKSYYDTELSDLLKYENVDSILGESVLKEGLFDGLKDYFNSVKLKFDRLFITANLNQIYDRVEEFKIDNIAFINYPFVTVIESIVKLINYIESKLSVIKNKSVNLEFTDVEDIGDFSNWLIQFSFWVRSTKKNKVIGINLPKGYVLNPKSKEDIAKNKSLTAYTFFDTFKKEKGIISLENGQGILTREQIKQLFYKGITYNDLYTMLQQNFETMEQLKSYKTKNKMKPDTNVPLFIQKLRDIDLYTQAIRDEKNKIEQEIERIETEKETLTNELNTSKSEKRQIEREKDVIIKQLENEIKKSVSSNEQKQKDIEEYKRLLTVQKNDYELKLRVLNDDLKQAIKDKKSAVSSSDKDKAKEAAYNNKINSLTKDIENLKQKYSKTVKDLASKVSENSSNVKEINRIKSRLETISKDKEVKSEKIRDLISKIKISNNKKESNKETKEKTTNQVVTFLTSEKERLEKVIQDITNNGGKPKQAVLDKLKDLTDAIEKLK